MPVRPGNRHGRSTPELWPTSAALTKGVIMNRPRTRTLRRAVALATLSVAVATIGVGVGASPAQAEDKYSPTQCAQLRFQAGFWNSLHYIETYWGLGSGDPMLLEDSTDMSAFYMESTMIQHCN